MGNAAERKGPPAAPGTRRYWCTSVCPELSQRSPPQQSSSSCNLRKPASAGSFGESVGLRKQWATPPTPHPRPTYKYGIGKSSCGHPWVWRAFPFLSRVVTARLRGEKLPCTLLAGQRGLEHVRERPPGLLLPKRRLSVIPEVHRFLQTRLCLLLLSPPPTHPPLKIFLLINNHQEIMKSQDLGHCSKGIALWGEHVLCVTL